MVTELQKKYSFKVEVIKKTDTGLLKLLLLPKLPALEINKRFVFEGQDITVEELEKDIKKLRHD